MALYRSLKFGAIVSQVSVPAEKVQDRRLALYPDKMVRMSGNGLGRMQQRFVEEYLKDNRGGAAQCAILAGYSPDTAHQQASRLLRNDKVKSALESGFSEKRIRNHFGADELVDRLIKVIDADPGDAVSTKVDGSIVLKTELRQILTHFDEISFVETLDKTGALKSRKTKIKFHDRIRAIELLMTLLGFGP